MFCCVTGVSGSGKSTLVNEVLYKAVANRLHRAQAAAGRAHAHHGPRPARQDHQHRPVADRPHAALQPGHLHRAVRPDPRPLLQDPGGAGARLQARPLLVQRQGRALRGLPRRRPDQDRDALPARRLRAVRAVPRQALQPRDARGPLQGQDDRRRARDAGRGGARVLRAHPEDPAAACRRCTTSGSTTCGSGQPATTLSGGEAQRVKLASELSKVATGPDALHPRRADHRPALRRHPAAARGARSAWSTPGNTVVVIEHNLDVIKTADRLIDLGPEGGRGGRPLVATGTPEQVAAVERVPHRRLPARGSSSRRRRASGRRGRKVAAAA